MVGSSTPNDSTNRIYLFDSAMTPATFWVKLDDIDFKPGALVKKLPLTGGTTCNGNASDKFVDAKLFNFASLDTKFEEPNK
jgi:choloylglycine hydrolase